MLYISFAKNEIYQIEHYAQFTVISRSALRCVFWNVKNIILVFKPFCICTYCFNPFDIQLNIRARPFSEWHYMCREIRWLFYSGFTWIFSLFFYENGGINHRFRTVLTPFSRRNTGQYKH